MASRAPFKESVFGLTKIFKIFPYTCAPLNPSTVTPPRPHPTPRSRKSPPVDDGDSEDIMPETDPSAGTSLIVISEELKKRRVEKSKEGESSPSTLRCVSLLFSVDIHTRSFLAIDAQFPSKINYLTSDRFLVVYTESLTFETRGKYHLYKKKDWVGFLRGII